MPSATESAAIVAVNVAFALPSNVTEPVKSPPSVIVREVVHLAAEPVMLATSNVPTVPLNTSVVFVASGIKVK